MSTRAEGSAYQNAFQVALAEAAREYIQRSGLVGDESLRAPVANGKGGAKRRQATRAGSETPRRALRHIVAPTDGDGEHIQAGALRVGMHVMCKSMPGTVRSISRSNTGKHGHAKVLYRVAGDVTGTITDGVVPADHYVRLAPRAPGTLLEEVTAAAAAAAAAAPPV